MEDLKLSAYITHKAVSDTGDSLVIKGFANTVTKDRAGDVILASAWETSNALANYMKNPIVLAFHDHSKPIGKTLSIVATSMGLEVEVEISKASGPIYELIKDGILKTFSVGFACLDAEYDVTTQIYVIRDVELHEISVVSVPCNQDSVFEVSKSLNAHDYHELKNRLIAKALPQKQPTLIEKLALELGIIKEL